MPSDVAQTDIATDFADVQTIARKPLKARQIQMRPQDLPALVSAFRSGVGFSALRTRNGLDEASLVAILRAGLDSQARRTAAAEMTVESLSRAEFNRLKVETAERDTEIWADTLAAVRARRRFPWRKAAYCAGIVLLAAVALRVGMSAKDLLIDGGGLLAACRWRCVAQVAVKLAPKAKALVRVAVRECPTLLSAGRSAFGPRRGSKAAA